jgi:large subunit ribosomal protein L28
MAKVCEICGRGSDCGHTVSHSHHKERKVRLANLQRVHVIHQGRRRRMWVCTRCLRAGKVQKA